jgi:hypothetical protein
MIFLGTIGSQNICAQLPGETATIMDEPESIEEKICDPYSTLLAAL